MKTTVQVDGKSVEVDIPGVIPEADVAAKYMPKDVFETELTRRGLSIAEKQGFINPTKLDDEGKKKLLESLGLELVADDGAGASGAVGKQLERAKAEWTERELTPVLGREKALTSEVENLRRDRLTDSLITAAAKAGVKPAFLNPPIAGAKPPIVAMLEQAFGFDAKSKQWYVRGASEDQPFVFAANPTGATPYKGVEEFLADWAKLPANKEFIGQVTQNGPGLGGGNAGGAAGADVVMLTPEQAGNAQLYAEALKRVNGDHARIKVRAES